ncbi:Gamma-aminobutyric acid receptor subunit beta-1 [Stylophora pistillata]|uniref:Gamma-aminobutyric acid receptor subunit beta-1 n=2 Tax=Stylophora pistillata TaxID=50429 RepID=A0A2B4SJ12_STYPI|nr:Gamma-aminobutyric acid receptor subunit beta-1 [Stylophora pistillata]
MSLILTLACNSQKDGYESEADVFTMVANGTIPPVNGAHNATGILKQLFRDYDKRLRPDYARRAIPITVSLGILSIGNIRTEDMEFTFDVYFRQIWKDTRLVFGSRDIALTLQQEALNEIWLPDTYFENAVKTFVHQETRTVVLYGDGLIIFSQRVTITATTLMNFRAYPMDTQVFRMDILSYGRDIKQLRYRGSNVQLINREMSEFMITKQSVEMDTKELFMGCFDVLTIKFTAVRRIGYYVIRIYLPCVLCTIVSWMAFWMDPAYIGDRSAIGITSLLTQIFLVGSISEAMPRVSYVNAADLFLIVSFSFTFLALFETAAVYRKAKSMCRTENVIPSQEEKKNDITNAESFESNQDESASSNGATAFRNHEKFSPHDDRLKVKLCTNFFGKMKGLDNQLDRIARGLFPVGYTVFITAYFLIFLIDL